MTEPDETQAKAVMDLVFARRVKIRDQLRAWDMPPDPDTCLALLVIAIECLMVAEGLEETPGPLSKQGLQWLLGVTMSLATGGQVSTSVVDMRGETPPAPPASAQP